MSLWDNETVDPIFTEEGLNDLVKSAYKRGIIDIEPNPETDGGFTAFNRKDGSIVKGLSNYHGVYAIFKDDQLTYIGLTGSSLRNRISRYIKEVKDVSHKDETHPGGKKHRYHFGKDATSGLSMMFFSLPDLPRFYQEEIEEKMINRFHPLFNKRGKKKKDK